MAVRIPDRPVTELMKQAHLQDADVGGGGHELIKADALTISKVFAGLVAGAGGMTAVAAAVGAYLADHDAVTIALIGVVGAVLIASAFIVGWIVTTDVKVRERLQRARYTARTEVLDDYFRLLDEDLLLGDRKR